jgi:predicted methyltransferase
MKNIRNIGDLETYKDIFSDVDKYKQVYLLENDEIEYVIMKKEKLEKVIQLFCQSPTTEVAGFISATPSHFL